MIKKICLVLVFFFWGGCAFSQKILPIKMTELAKQFDTAQGGITIFNFWSTWCGPCIAEIPAFLCLADSLKSKAVNLVLVSLDTKEIYATGKLKAFIKKQKWNAKMLWLNETNADYYCPLVAPAWSGVIPVTLVVNTKKNYKHFYEDALSKTALLQALVAAGL